MASFLRVCVTGAIVVMTPPEPPAYAPAFGGECFTLPLVEAEAHYFANRKITIVNGTYVCVCLSLWALAVFTSSLPLCGYSVCVCVCRNAHDAGLHDAVYHAEGRRAT